MSKSTRKIILAFIIMVCVAGAVIGGYYVLTKSMSDEDYISSEPDTEAGKLLAKDLETKYPETPTEVVKLYWRINKCMYNTSLEDEEFEGLLKQLRKLYHEELLAGEGNSWDDMLKNLRKEVSAYHKGKQTISTYAVQSASSVECKEVDGVDSAVVISNTLIKKKSKRTQSYEKFLCRRDADGNWKIVGWELTTDEEDMKAITG